MKIKHQKLFFILFFAVIMACGWGLAEKGHMKAEAAEENGAAANSTESDTKVKPVSIDYDALWLKVDANGNSKVYYSDKSKKTWYEAKPTTEDGKQYYYIDISWLSSTAKSVINLKGDKDDEIVSIELPARNSKLKAKYDKAKATISFENLEGEKEFEWRKATSYDWNRAIIGNDGKSDDAAFQEEIEKLRISGASIYVRLPQTKGYIEEESDTFKVGARQSKEIKVSITKLATAPKVTIDGTKLLLNTKETMEYSINNGTSWEKFQPMKAKMQIKDISKKVLYEYEFLSNGTISAFLPPAGLSAPTSVDILIRTAATGTKAASKSFLLTIPAQRPAPAVNWISIDDLATNISGEVFYSYDASKFYMKFTQASKTEPYEYLVVKPGIATPDLTKGWKAVTSAKTISLSSKTATAGSLIYIRKKTVKENAKTGTAFEIASAYMIIPVNYDTTATSTPAK